MAEVFYKAWYFPLLEVDHFQRQLHRANRASLRDAQHHFNKQRVFICELRSLYPGGSCALEAVDQDILPPLPPAATPLLSPQTQQQVGSPDNRRRATPGPPIERILPLDDRVGHRNLMGPDHARGVSRRPVPPLPPMPSQDHRTSKGVLQSKVPPRDRTIFEDRHRHDFDDSDSSDMQYPEYYDRWSGHRLRARVDERARQHHNRDDDLVRDLRNR
ncbi:hypothetical protein ANO11243_042100 [Dothideomycetidae sp. 11243]|nr:hypothetical protein ANO11243_042100 [fungal sp. No.11243]